MNCVRRRGQDELFSATASPRGAGATDKPRSSAIAVFISYQRGISVFTSAFCARWRSESISTIASMASAIGTARIPHTDRGARFEYDHLDFFTHPVDRTSGSNAAGGRFQRRHAPQCVAATDAADAASVVALKTLRP